MSYTKFRDSPSLACLRSILIVLYKQDLLGECISLSEISAVGLRIQLLEHLCSMYEDLGLILKATQSFF